MIYREQSDEIYTETWPSTDVLSLGMCLVWHIQQRLSLAMQLISNIDKHGYVATAVEVSQGSYMAWSSELVNRQEEHVVIEIYY